MEGMDAPSQGKISRDYLRQMFGDDPEFIKELLQLYLTDAQERVAALQAASVPLQWETIAHEAHQLKGASANVGAEGIRALAQQLEELARAQTEPAQVQQLIQQVVAAIAQVAQELE